MVSTAWDSFSRPIVDDWASAWVAAQKLREIHAFREAHLQVLACEQQEHFYGVMERRQRGRVQRLRPGSLLQPLRVQVPDECEPLHFLLADCHVIPPRLPGLTGLRVLALDLSGIPGLNHPEWLPAIGHDAA